MKLIKPTPTRIILEAGDNGDDLRNVIYDKNLEYFQVSIEDGELVFTE